MHDRAASFMVLQQLLPPVVHLIVQSKPAQELVLDDSASSINSSSSSLNMKTALSKLSLTSQHQPLQEWVLPYVSATCTASSAPHGVHVTGRGGYQQGMSNRNSKSVNAMAYYATMREAFGAAVTATCAALQAAQMRNLHELNYTKGE